MPRRAACLQQRMSVNLHNAMAAASVCGRDDMQLTRMAGKTLGWFGVVRSQMSSSPPAEPDASRLGDRRLKSRPLTAAAWFCMAARGAAVAEDGERGPSVGGEERTSAGFHKATVPSAKPPAIKPYCRHPMPCEQSCRNAASDGQAGCKGRYKGANAELELASHMHPQTKFQKAGMYASTRMHGQRVDLQASTYQKFCGLNSMQHRLAQSLETVS